jgi:WD40 repeat protein
VTAVFISYSRRDQAFVKRLHDALSAREYEVWVDWEDIPPSAQWVQEIRSGVGGSDGFIFVISPDSAASDVCRQELDQAVEQGKRIVPVLHREPNGVAVPPAASQLNWVFLRDSDDFNAGMGQLVFALETDLDHVRSHTRIGVEAARWEASRHDKSQLLRGQELAAAEAWLVESAGKQPSATQLQRQYLLESRQAATRRQRTLIGGVSIALVVAVALAIVALIQRSTAIQERNVAQARQYDAESANLATKNPVEGVLFAAKAAKLAPGTATDDALRQAILQDYERVRYLPPAGAVKATPDAVWSPDGVHLLVTVPGEAGCAPSCGAWIYRPGTSQAPIKLAGDAAPAADGESGWDARGDRLIIGGPHPGVYNSSTGGLIRQLPGPAAHTALSSDGAVAVTVDVNSVGHSYDVATGRELATFHPKFTSGVTCFALAPDEPVAAQCDTEALNNLDSSPADLDTWNVLTGKPIDSVPTPQLIDSVAFSSDGTRYVYTTTSAVPKHASLVAEEAAANAPGTFVYNTYGGRVIDFPGGASAAVFSPKLKGVPEAVAYATFNPDLVHVYQFGSGLTTILTGGTDTINALNFSPDGAYVVAAGRDDVARVYYSIVGGQPIETLYGHIGEITEAGFGRDDELIATASRDATARVWTGPVPQPRVALPAQAGGADQLANALSFTSDNERIVEASANGQGRVLAAADLNLVARFVAPTGQGFAGAAEARDRSVVTAVSGPYNPTTHVVSAFTNAELYDPASGRLLNTLTPATPGHLFTATLDYTGSRFATLGFNGDTDVWNTHTGQLLYHLPGDGIAAAAAFSKDGSQLAIMHYPAIPTVVTSTTTFGNVVLDIYNAQSGKLERAIQIGQLTPQIPGEASYAPLSVAFSPNATLLAAGGVDSSVWVYSAQTGKLIAGLPAGPASGDYANSLAFSPDGSYLAVGSTAFATVWRVVSSGDHFQYLSILDQAPSGTVAPDLTAGTGVTVGFTANSRDLVTGGDSAIAGWDLSSHLQLFHRSPVTRGNMSPSSNEFVTAGFTGLAVYSCEACGDHADLLGAANRITAQTQSSLSPSELANPLAQG